MKFQISNFKLRSAFSLIEVLVVVSLLSVIVLALMTVFTSTQRAFRAAVTQTDVLEGSRAAMELMAADLRGMTPSGSTSNAPYSTYYFTNGVNFYADANLYYNPPLRQSMPGSPTSAWRTNVLQNFFILSRDNVGGSDRWVATGYTVDLFSTNFLYPLYRFSANTNVTAAPPGDLFNAYMAAVVLNNFSGPNWSHIEDGVLNLRVRAYDANGAWLNPFYYSGNAHNARLLSEVYGEAGLYMFSNTVPAAVELELGVLEDRVLERAESLPNNLPAVPPNDRRTLYLQGLSGNVHLFRQRVSIPNVDPTAYQ